MKKCNLQSDENVLYSDTFYAKISENVKRKIKLTQTFRHIFKHGRKRRQT